MSAAGGASAGPGAPAAPAVNPWVVATAVMFSTVMVFLDTTVVNLSLPYIAGSLSASIDEATWSLTSYLAANAVVLPLAGWLSGLLGRRRLLMGSVASFTVASVLCGLAPNIEALVLFRVVQGLTGGVMQPLSQAVMLEGFAPEDRGKAMGFWSVGIIAAPIAGPLLGGWLTEHASWRWVFFINVPVGVVGLGMLALFVHDPPYVRSLIRRIDGWGIGMLALGIGALQVLFDQGQEEDWFESRTMTALLIVAVAMLALFVWRSLAISYPVVDLRVFRDRTFAAGAVLSALMGLLLYGSIVLLPLLLQTQLGYPPLDAGLIVVARAVGSLVMFPIAGILTSRVDPRRLLAVGLALGAITMFWFATLDRDLGGRDLFWPQVIQGVALGLLFVPLTTVTMSTIPREQMGNASSLFNVVRNLGSSVGIAIVSTMLARGQIRHRALLAERASELEPWVAARLDAVAASVGPAATGGFADAAEVGRLAAGRMLAQQAGMLAFLDSFRFLGWVFVVMLPLVLLLRRPRFDGSG
jgi:MFS transporter, DHA2 family, multidrug resistance protein